MIISINIKNGVESTSAEEANWWKRASPKRRENYIKKHPRSKYAKAVDSGEMDVNEPTVTKSGEVIENVETDDKEKTTKKKKKSNDKDKAKKTKKTKKAKKAKKTKLKKQKSDPKDRARQQLIEKETEKRTDVNLPIVQGELQDNFKEVSSKKDAIVKKVDGVLGERDQQDVRGAAGRFLKGNFDAKEASNADLRGMSKIGQILDTITEGLIGRNRYRSTAKTLGHTLLALFIGPSNYKEIKSVMEEARNVHKGDAESTSSVDAVRRKRVDEFEPEFYSLFDRIVPLRLVALSSDEEELGELDDEEDYEEEYEPQMRDSLDAVIGTYLDWFKQIDINKLSKKLARLEALREMSEEGYKPDDEEVNKLAEGEPEIPLELQDWESESSAVPRISFRVCPQHRHLPADKRGRFDVMFGGRQIGFVRSNPKVDGNGKSRRSWQCCLNEGYNESAFVSGRSQTEPYTIVNKNRVLLMNPNMLTFDEAKLWIKHVINKDFL